MSEHYAAHYWRMTPWDFKKLSRDSKAEAMASYFVSKEIEAYYSSERMKKMDAEIKRNKK